MKKGLSVTVSHSAEEEMSLVIHADCSGALYYSLPINEASLVTLCGLANRLENVSFSIARKRGPGANCGWMAHRPVGVRAFSSLGPPVDHFSPRDPFNGSDLLTGCPLAG